MGLAVKKPKAHPYISYKKDVCGGRSIIEGTRIPVWSIIKWYKIGMSLEEIMREFSQLTPAQIHDAFSYYYDNQEKIEKDVMELFLLSLFLKKVSFFVFVFAFTVGCFIIIDFAKEARVVYSLLTKKL